MRHCHNTSSSPIATRDSPGAIKIGKGFDIRDDGTCEVNRGDTVLAKEFFKIMDSVFGPDETFEKGCKMKRHEDCERPKRPNHFDDSGKYLTYIEAIEIMATRIGQILAAQSERLDALEGVGGDQDVEQPPDEPPEEPGEEDGGHDADEDEGDDMQM